MLIKLFQEKKMPHWIKIPGTPEFDLPTFRLLKDGWAAEVPEETARFMIDNGYAEKTEEVKDGNNS